MAQRSSRIAFAGIGKQTAKGTPLTNPTWGLGLRSGKPTTVDIDQGPDELTSQNPYHAQADRRGLVNGADYVSRAWPESIGLLLFAALGAIQTAGAGPYTHTITIAAAKPYLTAFGREDDLYTRVQDAKIDELAFSWDEAKPPELAIRLQGGALLKGTLWTPGTDETENAKLISSGGTFQVDAGAIGAPVDAPITGGSIRIRNNLEAIILSQDIEADDQYERLTEVEYSFRLKVQDAFEEWSKIVTGSAGGTTFDPDPVYGSALVKFVQGASSCQIESDRVAFLADFPDANPSGDAAVVQVTGEMYDPVGAGEPVTATVINDVSSY